MTKRMSDMRDRNVGTIKLVPDRWCPSCGCRCPWAILSWVSLAVSTLLGAKNFDCFKFRFIRQWHRHFKIFQRLGDQSLKLQTESLRPMQNVLNHVLDRLCHLAGKHRLYIGRNNNNNSIDSVRLQILLTGTCRRCGSSWSVGLTYYGQRHRRRYLQAIFIWSTS